MLLNDKYFILAKKLPLPEGEGWGEGLKRTKAMLPHTPQALINAKQLRQQQTQAEQQLWSKLRHRQLAGLKFRRQVPIGAYIVDFYCHEQGLVVELDGSQHIEQAAYDEVRSQFLQAQGLTVLRFWNNVVLTDVDSVLQQVWNATNTRV